MSEEIQQLHDNFDNNYALFIEQALATGCVWGLESEKGWALCPSLTNEEVDVMPVWSQPEFAQTHCVDEWSIYQPVPISIDEFLDDWLPGMHEDTALVGPNWNSNLEGFEIEPLDLLEDIESSLTD